MGTNQHTCSMCQRTYTDIFDRDNCSTRCSTVLNGARYRVGFEFLQSINPITSSGHTRRKGWVKSIEIRWVNSGKDLVRSRVYLVSFAGGGEEEFTEQKLKELVDLFNRDLRNLLGLD